MTTPPPNPALGFPRRVIVGLPATSAPVATPEAPFRSVNDSDGYQCAYLIDLAHLPEVRAEEGTGAGQLTFRTPNGALAATGISTSQRLFAAAAESLALAHAVAAHEDAQRDSERQAALTAEEVQA